MQRLFFEDAWEKTISLQDRQKIQRAFNERKTDQGLIITYLWEAKNHLGDLLVTSLIHNHTGEAYNIDNKKIQYKSNMERFHLPISIPAYHSMPWTFIFSQNLVTGEADLVMTEANQEGLK